MRWSCPSCDREFGRANSAHTCVPGTTVDSVFAGRPPYMRSVYDEIVAALRESGPVHEDAVTVGVFLKARRKIAEVRPMARSLRVWLLLPREVPGLRSVRATSEFWAVDLRFTSGEVGEDVRALLDEAYDAAV
jgi:hypothetical protein